MQQPKQNITSIQYYLYVQKQIFIQQQTEENPIQYFLSLPNQKFGLFYKQQIRVYDITGSIVQTIKYHCQKIDYFYKNCFISTKSGIVLLAKESKLYDEVLKQWISLPFTNFNQFQFKVMYFSQSNNLVLMIGSTLQICDLYDPSQYFQTETDWKFNQKVNDNSLILINIIAAQVLTFYDIIYKRVILQKFGLKVDMIDRLVGMFVQSESSIYLITGFDDKIYITQQGDNKILKSNIKHNNNRIKIDTNECKSLQIYKMSKQTQTMVIAGNYGNHGKLYVYNYTNNIILFELQSKYINSTLSSNISDDLSLFGWIVHNQQTKQQSTKTNKRCIKLCKGINKNKIYIHLLNEIKIISRFGSDICKNIMNVLN